MKPRQIFEMMPLRFRNRVKLLLGSAGHGRSWLDGIKARDSARGKKRLDHSARDLAHRFTVSGIPSVAGKTCLEFGAGYVPSEALIFHLMGAARVVTTDYNAIAHFDQLYVAAETCNRKSLFNALEKIGDAVKADKALDALCRLGPSRGVSHLKEVIEYIAPHDLARSPVERGQFDLISSLSVLEHVPPTLISAILENLRASLALGGVMANIIDLRDHSDLEANPLSFLASNTDYNVARDFDVRGNRLRIKEWDALFGQLPNTTTAHGWKKMLDHDKVPAKLLPDFDRLDREDVRVGLVLMLSRDKN